MLANVLQAEGKYSEAERTLLDEIEAEEQQGEANVQLAQALVRLATTSRNKMRMRKLPSTTSARSRFLKRRPKARGASSQQDA